MERFLARIEIKSIIPWTHDMDLAYFRKDWTPDIQDILLRRLRDRGLNLFFDDPVGIWRVCLSTQHPLAAKIWNRNGDSSQLNPGYGGDIPYLDLYALTEEGEKFRLDGAAGLLQRENVLPLKKCELLGKQYDTFQSPELIFEKAGYGDFMSERREPHRRI